MKLLHPWLLLLLLLWIPMIYQWIRLRRKGIPSITISSSLPFAKTGGGYKLIADYLALVLRLLAVGALIVALARPQKHDSVSDSTINGTEIVLALDISQSMLTPDMQPTRFDAAISIASDFVADRDNDNVALVAFSGESLTMMPLTTDREAVIGALKNLQPGSLGDNTALGDGLVTAINRLVDGKAESKSVILLTDGANNAGEVDPIAAAEVAKEKGIRVYTIAVGQDQVYNMGSFFDPYATISAPVDTESLQKIAKITDGKYFRALDKGTLKNVFSEIDKLQKSVISTKQYTHTQECFMPWVIFALCAFLLEVLMRYTVLRRIP